MADYRPVVNHRTERVVLLNVKVECPAGWWMPLHSDKKYWVNAKRMTDEVLKLRRVDTLPPPN